MLKSRLLLERQVNTVARKKIVFVIVEGPSDDEALGVLLEKVFNSSTVFVYITHGDITSKPGTDPSRILAVVGDLVKGYAKSNHLNNTHFQEIIHITDTDGAFIPDESVVEDPSATKAQYTLTEIRTANVEGILIRNALKSQCLNRLSGAQKIWGIPYQAYYMSCNLDHVLHDKQNSSDEEKEKNALAFAKRYRQDVDGFIKFIAESDFSVTSNYVESWNYIKQGVRSLERHTNLGLCLTSATEVDAESDAPMD